MAAVAALRGAAVVADVTINAALMTGGVALVSRSLVWRLQCSDSRYALALAADKLDGAHVWVPGYESHDIGDIVQAIWYLENNFKGALPERKLQMLDMIKSQAAAELPDYDIYGISRKGGSCGI